MAWFVTLASKMTGKEIPGVGMAPGGKIKKPKEEVEEYLQHFLIIADAMAKNKIGATPSSRSHFQNIPNSPGPQVSPLFFVYLYFLWY